MPYDKDRSTGSNGHPSLSEMVNKAIDVLSRNPNGYILIVRLHFQLTPVTSLSNICASINVY